MSSMHLSSATQTKGDLIVDLGVQPLHIVKEAASGGGKEAIKFV